MQDLLISDKLRQELYQEATTNGFDRDEYLRLLRQVDHLLNTYAQTTKEAREGIKPKDYNMNGEEF